VVDKYDLIVIGGGASLAQRLAPSGKKILILERGEYLPTGPPAGKPYPFGPVRHEPEIAELSRRLEGIGLKPFHLPLGILLDQKDDGFATPTSVCMRCTAFDGFPRLLNGKADAQVICIDPMLAKYDNVTMLTGAYVSKLGIDANGRRVEAVQVERAGRQETYCANTVVVACGALSSALLLLRSANPRHPDGLANGSGQVGRNYMRHEMSIVMAVMRHPNDTVFKKTLALSDFYFGSDGWEYPLGLIQMCAKSRADQIKGEPLPAWLDWLPEMPFEEMARHSMDFWLQSEDLPHPDNRVYYKDGKVHLDVIETNPEALKRLKHKLEEVLPSMVGLLSCWNAHFISPVMFRCQAPRTRRARAVSARTRRPPCSTWIVGRTKSTISISRMRVSFLPSAP
jgi:choline dehydrogenase-like flavoprotein